MTTPGNATQRITAQSESSVLSALRAATPGLSWANAKRLMAERRIAVNGILCVDEARRVREGDLIEVLRRPLPPPPRDADVDVLFQDEHVIVVHKPAGMLTLRHPGDVGWTEARRQRQPSLDECIRRQLEGTRRRAASPPELLAVQRLDRETSGILVFALHRDAQRGLIRQFADHSADRRYHCVVPGHVSTQRIETQLLRDRGDGLRGSARQGETGQRMVTHIQPIRSLGTFTELECRLETGRTNQIRIHLAELGHPVCGDVKYRGPFSCAPLTDTSGVPRLALHAAVLGFLHPITGRTMRFERPWPPDMAGWIRLNH